MSEVVVIPFGTPDVTTPLAITDALESVLAQALIPFIPLHDARDRFTSRSRPPQKPSDSDLDVLDRAAHETIEHVAFGRINAAQRSVRQVISRAERTLESLNRETATARNLLDACLSLVRSVLLSGNRELALEQATSCRRLVPDLMPSEQVHPANVVGVLAEADNMLRRMRIGHLTVRSAPETGCSVYVNGRHLGTTPFRLERAAAGNYRVQVECGNTLARVHVVQLGDQPATLAVDTQLDRAVVSDPRLLLRYGTAKEAREQAVSHATELGREVGATDAILVGVHNEHAELLRVQVEEQRLVASASVPWSEHHGFPRRAVEQAIAALTEGRLEGEQSLRQVKEPVAQSAASGSLPTLDRDLTSAPRDVELVPSVVEDGTVAAASESEHSHANRVNASGPVSPERAERPTYKKWWFWTSIGLAVSAGIITTVLLVRPDGESEVRAVQGTNTTGVSLQTLAAF